MTGRSPLQVDGATTVDVPTAARLHDRGVPFADGSVHPVEPAAR